MSQIQKPSTWPENALPLLWIEKIFHKLTLMYGSRFTGMWDGIDFHELKQAWAEDLAAFKNQPEKIKYALDACKHNGWPPTVSEFFTLCQEAPNKITAPQLPAPMPDKDMAQKRLEAAAEVIARPGKIDHLRWAKRTYISPRAQEMIMELVEARDPRFKPIFMDHYKAGRIKGSRADSLSGR